MMVKIEQIRKEMGRSFCLDCLNKRYHARLREEDCFYDEMFPHRCPHCSRLLQDVILGLHLSGKLKLLFKR